MIEFATMRTAWFAVPFALAFALHLRADMLVKDYKVTMATQGPDAKITRYWVKGLGEGFIWANFKLLAEHRNPLFCPPEKLSLTTESYLDIIDIEIVELSTVATQKQMDEMSVGVVLTDGLRKRFPCKEK
jgi:hypothetical protein